jgi:hypothetical protein
MLLKQQGYGSTSYCIGELCLYVAIVTGPSPLQHPYLVSSFRNWILMSHILTENGGGEAIVYSTLCTPSFYLLDIHIQWPFFLTYVCIRYSLV